MTQGIHRRAALAAVLAVAMAGGAAAQEKPKAPPQVGKAFRFLDAYLKIPAAERNRFTLSYYLRQPGDRPPPPGVRMFVVQGGQRTELPIAANGRVTHPTLAMLTNKAATLVVDKPTPDLTLGFDMELEATARPAAQMNAAELTGAIDQANRGIKRAAGVIGMVAPKMAGVKLEGAGSGEVVLADGRRAPLPVVAGAPAFMPASFPGAQTLVLARAPTRVLIGPAPKPKKK
jgi:hypothetical protein